MSDEMEQHDVDELLKGDKEEGSKEGAYENCLHCYYCRHCDVSFHLYTAAFGTLFSLNKEHYIWYSCGYRFYDIPYNFKS